MARMLYVTVGGAILLASAGAAATVARPKAPPLLPDPPLTTLAPSGPSSLPLARRLDPPAMREKAAPVDVGVCDYPGAFVPCWCANLGLPTSCSAAEYLEDVQRFGPPRAYVEINDR